MSLTEHQVDLKLLKDIVSTPANTSDNQSDHEITSLLNAKLINANHAGNVATAQLCVMLGANSPATNVPDKNHIEEAVLTKQAVKAALNSANIEGAVTSPEFQSLQSLMDFVSKSRTAINELSPVDLVQSGAVEVTDNFNVDGNSTESFVDVAQPLISQFKTYIQTHPANHISVEATNFQTLPASHASVESTVTVMNSNNN